ncbi:unnamed protein product [Menidia menidia]|uniref:(Atlantic silverside) hypothetical protein n=1 Tax=Menidia menidia TaxID=238744 RepID=A0A8S4AGT1_9TELE|nr:unnamed protein product [Menidia menidia]
MGKSKQIGNHKSDKKKNISKTWKTKRRTKDLDQIHSDMKPETAAKLMHQEVDYDTNERSERGRGRGPLSEKAFSARYV